MKTLLVLALMVMSLYGSLYINFVAHADGEITPDPIWFPERIYNGTIAWHGQDTFIYTLEAGKSYHVFLVGNWTEPDPTSTDYDIYVTSPSGEEYRFTEAKGLPEQAFNDVNGWLFVPKESGVYRFEVHNDSDDPVGAYEGAIFMLIEHVETDRLLNATVVGRTSKNGDYPPFSQLTYACGFTTSSTNFTIPIMVPEDLDLYEVRLFRMAAQGAHGHEINGLPTPFGTDFFTDAADFGGYNYTMNGPRGQVYASFYDYGVGGVLSIGSEETTESALTTYFLVFIAEYSKTPTPSTVQFYIKTENTGPVLTLGEPINAVSEGELTKVYANVTSGRTLSSVWLNTYINGVLHEAVQMTPEGSQYMAILPSFIGGDVVDYTISAEDEIGNVGEITGSFIVRARTATTCGVSTAAVAAGDTLTVSGAISLGNVNVVLRLTNPKESNEIVVKSDADGGYKYEFVPKVSGNWTVTASYAGDDRHYASQSDSIGFTMVPRFTAVSCSLVYPSVKVNSPVEIVGNTVPPQAGLPLEVMLVSGGVVKTIPLVTGDGGSFSLSEKLDEGQWDIVVQVKGNWKYSTSSSGLVVAEVLPLTYVDVILIGAATATAPPYLYALLLASGIILALIVRWKSPWIVPRLPDPVRGVFARLTAPAAPKKRQASGERVRYKRQADEG